MLCMFMYVQDDACCSRYKLWNRIAMVPQELLKYVCLQIDHTTLAAQHASAVYVYICSSGKHAVVDTVWSMVPQELLLGHITLLWSCDQSV